MTFFGGSGKRHLHGGVRSLLILAIHNSIRDPKRAGDAARRTCEADEPAGGVAGGVPPPNFAALEQRGGLMGAKLRAGCLTIP